MKPARFEYHRPASLAETFDLLDRYGDDGRILAGGQSLVPALNMRLATPRAVIDINRLPGLDDIRLSSEGLVIGALTRQEALERSPLVRDAEVRALLGDREGIQVRVVGDHVYLEGEFLATCYPRGAPVPTKTASKPWSSNSKNRIMTATFSPTQSRKGSALSG